MTVHNAKELTELVLEYGFLPLQDCGIPNFSVAALTDPRSWEVRGENNPWEWRYSIASVENIAYGKLFGGKIGFISAEWFPIFANYRRRGYDFDALYDDGGAAYTSKRIMELFEDKPRLLSWEVKPYATEAELARLQMQTYILIVGFEKKLNKFGEEYGWGAAVYGRPEEKFGAELVRLCYSEPPEASRERISERASQLCPHASVKEISKLLG